MPKIRVGVLRGGPSSEYEVSLKSGETVINHLPEHYVPVDILITKDGLWHDRGLTFSPDSLPRKVDVVFNALHGEYGEDGGVQRLLDSLKVKYTGSGHFSSALAMNKHLAKMVASRLGIKTPKFVLREENESLENLSNRVIRSFSPPWVIKPISKGSSVGVVVASHFPELFNILSDLETADYKFIIEEYIAGKEATCGVVENFRGQKIYALPSVEIRKPQGKTLFDYEAKYSGTTEEVCPGCFQEGEKKELESLSATIHEALGLADYSRSDFIVNRNGIYYLETNSLPGLTPNSLLPKSLAAVGVKSPHFIDHILKQALSR